MIVARASSMPKRHILEIISHSYDCFPNRVTVARLGPPRCEQDHAPVVGRRVSNGPQPENRNISRGKTNSRDRFRSSRTDCGSH